MSTDKTHDTAIERLTLVQPPGAETHLLDGWQLPEHWGDEARDAFAEVVAHCPDIEGPDLNSALQACEMVDTATRLDRVARAANYMTRGSAGQDVLHPAATEARLNRTAASAIFARLNSISHGAMTASDRARLAARARWSRPQS